MSRDEYNGALGIEKEMKVNGKNKLLVVTPLAVVGPSEGIIVVEPSTQIPSVPYVQVHKCTMS